MEDITIPRELLDEFSGSFQSENGAEGSRSMAGRAAIVSLEKSLAWVIQVSDQFARERDLPGIGKMSNTELAELVTIVLERNLGADFMQRSPEFLLGCIGTGIISSNLIAHKRNQEQAEKAKAKKTKPDDKKD